MIGLAFYLLGGKTRREPAVEPAVANTQVDHTEQRIMTRAAPFGFNRVVFLSHVVGERRPVYPGDPPS